MKNVAAYCRVSTDGQTKDDKFGIDVQKEQIADYCKRNDMNIVSWFIDAGVSGVKESRPQFDRILFGDVENPPIEAVIVMKNDRIARDINIYFYYKMLLRKKNIELISISEDFGQFGVFSSILEAFTLCVAEQERENITKRTSSGRTIKAELGGYAGGKAPFGYKVENGNLVINQAEAVVVKTAFSMRNDGATMKSICDGLKNAGYKNRKGGDFSISTIQSILGNENTYRGMYRYGQNGEWVKGQQKSIL